VVYRASQPQEKVIVTTLEKLAVRMEAEKITKHALIIIGKVLDVDLDNLKHKSKLYDRDFKHGCRA
jgi:precorrin-4/cobalt-precorrin-4 C11-methyltransferase